MFNKLFAIIKCSKIYQHKRNYELFGLKKVTFFTEDGVSRKASKFILCLYIFEHH